MCRYYGLWTSTILVTSQLASVNGSKYLDYLQTVEFLFLLLSDKISSV